LCRPAKLGDSRANGLDTLLWTGVNVGWSKVEQSLAPYTGRLATDDPQGSFAAEDRKIHTIYSIRFSDGIVPFGLQTRHFERAPEEVMLTRAEE
jgi:hypothetical protein